MNVMVVIDGLDLMIFSEKKINDTQIMAKGGVENIKVYTAYVMNLINIHTATISWCFFVVFWFCGLIGCMCIEVQWEWGRG